MTIAVSTNDRRLHFLAALFVQANPTAAALHAARVYVTDIGGEELEEAFGRLRIRHEQCRHCGVDRRQAAGMLKGISAAVRAAPLPACDFSRIEATPPSTS